MEKEQLKKGMLAALFASPEPLDIEQMAQKLEIPAQELSHLVFDLEEELVQQHSPMLITRIQGRITLCTNEEYEAVVKKLISKDVYTTLTNSVMETLSIIAYKQPVTRAQVDAIRGVNCQYAISILLERGLIREDGKKDTIGRPNLYVTTEEFLKHFGLESLEELPALSLLDLDESSEEGEIFQ